MLRGRISAQQMRAAAEAASRFASGELRTTNMQNLLIVNVPNQNVEALASEFHAMGLPVGGSPFWRGVVACSGTEFCKVAITETKSFSRWLVEELEERLPGFEQHLKLHVMGCPNSCGQHWIADIGIEGKKIKVDGRARCLLLLRRRGRGIAPVGGSSHRLSLPGRRSAGRHRTAAAALSRRTRIRRKSAPLFCPP